MLQKENINNIKDGNVRKSDIKSIREQHDKKIKSLDSIKQNHSAQVKMIREESKGGTKMGVIEKHVLLDSLKNNVLDITFRKMDGSIRVMKCTLRPDYIPEGNKPDDENTIGRDYSTMDVDTMYQFCGDKPERWAAAMTTNLPPDLTKIPMTAWLTGWISHVIESSVVARKTYDRSQIIRVWELNSGWRSFYLDRVTSVQMATP